MGNEINILKVFILSGSYEKEEGIIFKSAVIVRYNFVNSKAFAA